MLQRRGRSVSDAVHVRESSALMHAVAAQRSQLGSSGAQVTPAGELRHYHMYFDDAGAVDVIAASVTVEAIDVPNR